MSRTFIDRLDGLRVSAADRAQIHEDLVRVSDRYKSVWDAGDCAVMGFASGVKPGAPLRRFLTVIADISVVTGEDASAVVPVLARAAAAGLCQGDTLVRLASMGVPTAQLLAGHLGVEAESVRERASAGRISFEDLLGALEKGVGGASRLS